MEDKKCFFSRQEDQWQEHYKHYLWETLFWFYLFFRTFVLGCSRLTNNVMVSGEEWRDSATQTHVSILPQTLLLSRLSHNTRQSSLHSTVGSCRLPILNTAVCVCPSQTPWLSHPPHLFLQKTHVHSQVCESLSVLYVKLWGTQMKVCLQSGRPGFDPWVRKTPWRRQWQPTPVFLPGKSHGPRSLAGYSPWGRRVGHDWAISLWRSAGLSLNPFCK